MPGMYPLQVVDTVSLAIDVNLAYKAQSTSKSIHKDTHSSSSSTCIVCLVFR
jgi:hypothetical protein